MSSWVQPTIYHTLSLYLWKAEFLKPKPFSPVQSALKFSVVLGTCSAAARQNIGIFHPLLWQADWRIHSIQYKKLETIWMQWSLLQANACNPCTHPGAIQRMLFPSMLLLGIAISGGIKLLNLSHQIKGRSSGTHHHRVQWSRGLDRCCLAWCRRRPSLWLLGSLNLLLQKEDLLQLPGIWKPAQREREEY